MPRDPHNGQTVTLRRRVRQVLDVSVRDDALGWWIDAGLISLIALNVLAVIVESVPSIGPAWSSYFSRFETFSVIVFSLEYGLRVWSAPERDDGDFRDPVRGRLRYVLTPLALIDLMVIAPFYLGFLIAIDLRFLRVFRLLRIFKLSRYSASMQILLTVLKEEARAIASAMFVLLLLTVVAAALAFMAENKAQPEAFASIPQTMWWAIITMTTVGYGDIVPLTPLGKLLGAGISIIGMGMVALPAGMLAAGFSNQLHRRRREFTDLVESVIEDGVITPEEAERLHQTQETLGIHAEDARDIIETEIRAGGAHLAACPHCGKPLKLTDRGRGVAAEKQDAAIETLEQALDQDV